MGESSQSLRPPLAAWPPSWAPGLAPLSGVQAARALSGGCESLLGRGEAVSSRHQGEKG